MRNFKLFAFFSIIVFLCNPVFGWYEHSVITKLAMDNNKFSEEVSAETLKDFLTSEASGIAKLLDDEELWLEKNVSEYPKIPDNIRFSKSTEPDILKKFFYALRVNPLMDRKLYAILLPGEIQENKKIIPFTDVSAYKVNYTNNVYMELSPGEKISSLKVLYTASSEPDEGADLNVWADSKTDFGKSYNMGPLPFGNPNVEFATATPFHMGLYNESGIIYFASPGLKKCYPQVRIRIYSSLAKYAFQTGHKYWGYRFAGMGLHYIQDLTMPYHVALAAGHWDIELLMSAVLNAMFISGPYNNVLNDISVKHLFIEKYLFLKLADVIKSNDMLNIFSIALNPLQKDTKEVIFSDDIVKELARTIKDKGEITSSSLDRIVTNRDMLNKFIELEEKGNYDAYDIIKGAKQQDLDFFTAVLADLMHSCGIYTRAYINSIIK